MQTYTSINNPQTQTIIIIVTTTTCSPNPSSRAIDPTGARTTAVPNSDSTPSVEINIIKKQPRKHQMRKHGTTKHKTSFAQG